MCDMGDESFGLAIIEYEVTQKTPGHNRDVIVLFFYATDITCQLQSKFETVLWSGRPRNGPQKSHTLFYRHLEWK